jgi:hypothetical protein
LAHAISRTIPTTAINTNSGCENWWRKLEIPVDAGLSASFGTALPPVLHALGQFHAPPRIQRGGGCCG